MFYAMIDIRGNIEEYILKNTIQTKRRKILFVFDDMTSLITGNKALQYKY